MKKTKIMLTAISFLTLFSCGTNENTPIAPTASSDSKVSVTSSEKTSETITVTFDYNYENCPASQTVSGEAGKITEPSAPTRDYYDFIGWYTDKECTQKADFSALTKTVTVYAGWKQQTVTVTFHYGYEGSTDSEITIGKGDKLSKPNDPEREGYIFTNWYTDEALTNEYDFSSVITDSVTLYAEWEEDAGDTNKVTFLLNYDDNEVYYSTRIKNGRRVSAPEEPTREGYVFGGWFTDKECTVPFSFSTFIKENTTLYAKWMQKYTFEAEYTDLEDKVGNGYSSESAGLDLIVKDYKGTLNASNGYYLANLYNPGLSIDFTINSDVAVTDAKMTLRLSVEYYDQTFSNDNFKIKVNGTDLTYSDIAITGAVPVNDELTQGKRPFTDYDISSSVCLNAGENTINLVMDNNNELGGTMYAEAPMIDCMYLVSSSELTWSPLTDNLL